MLGRTILSVLAGWSLLGVIAGGLFKIYQRLEGIRGSMQKIAMGVRAIEQETKPLDGHIVAVAGSLTAVADGLETLARGLDQLDTDLGKAAPALPALLTRR